MNFQCKKPTDPLRVIIINPLVETGQLLAVKMLSGYIFGEDQRLKLNLLVYENELSSADALKIELEKCAFPCTHSIKVTTDMPSISDADVFCFVSTFKKPNSINSEDVNDYEHFDSLYLIMKIAINLKWQKMDEALPEPDKHPKGHRKNAKDTEKKKYMKPIIIADGLSTIDIIHSFSENLPNDIFFCPSAFRTIAASALADYLKVQTTKINKVFVWAADEEVFYVEVEKPLIVDDKITNKEHCDWDMISKKSLKHVDFDATQMNAAWMKKDFMEKIKTIASKNPYGSIYKASEMAKALKTVWIGRSGVGDQKKFGSLGVISNGALDSVKGLAYVLPLELTGDTWAVDDHSSEDPHLRLEMRRINKAAIRRHNQLPCPKLYLLVDAINDTESLKQGNKLVTYCRKFLQENVLNQAFLHGEEECSETDFV